VASLIELEQWDEELYQLETTDPVIGGPNGISNQQAQTLGNRTRYLNALKVTIADLQKGTHVTAVDTGAANAYVVALSPAVAALANGMEISFTPANSNTGASTITVNGLAAVPIVGGALSALQGGEIVASGRVKLKYNSTISSFVIISTTGALQTADATKTKHATTLNQFGAVLSQNGYQKLPSGLILQWQLVSHTTAGTQQFTYPIAFPNTSLFVIATDQTAANPALTIGVAPVSATAFTVTVTDSAGAAATGGAVMVLSIGY